MTFFKAPGWRLFSLALLGTLTGCTPSLQSKAPSPDVYQLRPVLAQASVERPLRLQVLTVRVRPGYATDDILRSGPDRRLEIFAASRWPDVLPRMIEGLLVDGLKSAGLGEVLEPLSAGRADWLLQGVVRRFDVDYSADPRQPRIHVTLDITVMERARREVVLSFTVASVVPASQNRMGAIITAFELASAEALAQIAQRLADPTWAAEAGAGLAGESRR